MHNASLGYPTASDRRLAHQSQPLSRGVLAANCAGSSLHRSTSCVPVAPSPARGRPFSPFRRATAAQMVVAPPREQRGPLGKVNGFQLLKFLGKGTFGAVYQARREADGKVYAIKKVDTRRMTTKERAEAVNEIRVLASVAGEHVITFYEAFVEQDILYIVTEFAGNGDLLQYLKSKRRAGHLPEATVWSFFIQMCLGVKAMHENNILHRDLKAANVFLCSNSYLKLGDLGVAKVLKHDQALASTQVGTPYYVAPEVWRNKVRSAPAEHGAGPAWSLWRQERVASRVASRVVARLAAASVARGLHPAPPRPCRRLPLRHRFRRLPPAACRRLPRLPPHALPRRPSHAGVQQQVRHVVARLLALRAVHLPPALRSRVDGGARAQGDEGAVRADPQLLLAGAAHDALEAAGGGAAVPLVGPRDPHLGPRAISHGRDRLERLLPV